MYVPLEEELDSTFMGAASKMTFATVTGKLLDNQYATQANGFHWVKLPGYTMIKIDPEYISKNILSQAGVNFIQAKAGTE